MPTSTTTSTSTMSEDDQLPFLESIRTCNWQLLASVLKNSGPQRARQLVTSLVDPEQRATALTVCARSTPPSSHSHTPTSTSNGLHPHEDSGKEGGGLMETCQVLVNYGADLNHRDRGGRTPLHWAVETNKASLAAMLLSLGAEVTVADHGGYGPLHAAVRAGSSACVALLIQHDPQLLEERDSQGTPPLTLAVQKGHSDLCRQLLQAGADVTAQESQTLRTPLHYALYLNHLHIFVLLLSYKPNLQVVDHRGTTIVHRSCSVQEPRYLAHVLSSDCDHVLDVINMEDKEGATPIIIACQTNSLSNVQLLLDNGAKVSAKDIHGRTALHHCVENTDTECAELLLKTDPSLLSTADDEGLTPLHMAVIAGNVPFIRLLLKRGASLQCKDQEDHTVAHWATVCGHSRVLDVLLEYGAELSVADKHQAYPIHYAAQMTRAPGDGEGEDGNSVGSGDAPHNSPFASSPRSPSGHARLLKKLLDSQVSPEVKDKDGRTPVIWAASAGNAEACRILVKAGADVNSADKDGLSALHCAASRGHSECVRVLVRMCKATVDPTDRNQCTPLFYSTTLGHEECSKILLELGASPSHTDSRGRTTAHCAAVTGSRESLEALAKQGVDLWQPTAKGDYPIHEAAQSGHVEAIEYLLEIRKDEDDEDQEEEKKKKAIDTANRDGRTCLHIAALTNNLWLAKFLLDHHADVNAEMRNKGKNYTPYDAAVAKGNKEAADYLQSRGGRPSSSRRPSSSKSRDRSRPSSSKSKDRPSSSKSKDRPASSKSRERPESSKSKDRPASSKSRERPESSKSQDRPKSSKSKERPESSKSKERPESSKSKDRPESSKSKDRPASSKSKDSPSSCKVKDRPPSGKSSEGNQDNKQPLVESGQGVGNEKKEDKVASEATGDGQESDEAPPVLAVVITHSDRSRSSSPQKDKPGSPKKDKENSSDEEAKSSSMNDKKEVKQTDSKKMKSKAGAESNRGTNMVMVVPANDDSSSQHQKRPTSLAKQKDPETHSSSRKQSPKQRPTKANDSSKDNKDVSVKKEDSHKKEVRVQDNKEQNSAGSKNHTKNDSANKSASVNRNKTTRISASAPPKTRETRQRQQQQQKQATKMHRSRTTSSSCSRSRSSSRDSQFCRNKHNDKKTYDENDGEGLNLFSDNENTDHEDEAIANRQTADEAAAEHQGGGKDQKKRPRSSRLIATVQDSVKRYEQDRRSIRELQQMRRAQIYSNHSRNVALFHSLLRVYGTPNGAPTWDQLLQDQPAKTRDMDQQNRSKTNGKLPSRGDNKDSTPTDSKEELNQNHANDEEDSEDGKTDPVGRRHGGATTAKGNHSAGKENTERQPHSDSPPPRSPSPRRQKYYEYGDPMLYRQIQRQRSEDMHRLLLKAYRPSLPHDLFLHGNPSERTQSAVHHSRPSRPSTSKSLPARTSSCQGRPSSMTSSGSGQQTTIPSGMSQAQFRAAQKSYTIMTPYGTRRIRPRSGHHTTWSQSQRHGANSRQSNVSRCSNGTTEDHSNKNHGDTPSNNHR